MEDKLAQKLAERQGFEPWIEFPLYTLSKRAPSTTRPSLRLRTVRGFFSIACGMDAAMTARYNGLKCLYPSSRDAPGLLLLRARWAVGGKRRQGFKGSASSPIPKESPSGW